MPGVSFLYADVFFGSRVVAAAVVSANFLPAPAKAPGLSVLPPEALTVAVAEGFQQPRRCHRTQQYLG